MNFSFGETIGKSQSSVKNKLEGNKIHSVKFDGCVVRESAPGAEKSYSVIDVKFSNDEGEFVHSIWKPKEEDYKPRNAFGIENPPAIWNTIYFLSHLIDAVNPKLATAIKNKEKSIDIDWKNWDQIKAIYTKTTDSVKGAQTQIKLIKNKKGEAIIPYFLGQRKDGDLYMKCNFLGDKLGFSSKELEAIEKSKAAPTAVNDSTPFVSGPSESKLDDLDFNF
jgi:hypothetical protein